MSVLRPLRRITPLVGAAALLATGTAVGAEVTELIGGQWRTNVADALVTVVQPGWRAWQSALVGAGLAVVAIALIAAEFTRPSKGTRILHSVHNTSNGSTRITGKATIHAVVRRLAGIDGIVNVDATTAKTAVTVIVRVDDRANLERIETQVRDRLDHEFWINLGLADFSVNLLITHHPRPPRVR